MELREMVKKTVLSLGVWEVGLLPTEELVFYPEIRSICRKNTCRNYGTSWACPPAVGTLEKCKDRLLSYRSMLLFTQKYCLEDSFDFDGMMQAMRSFKQIAVQIHRELDAYLADFILLANEGCGRCTACTYPNAPCRYPEMLHHAIEGYGLCISELAQKVGIHYGNGPDTVTYFGAVLFDLFDRK